MNKKQSRATNQHIIDGLRHGDAEMHDMLETWDLAIEILCNQGLEEELRDQFPALQNAWDSYQITLKMCLDDE